MKYWLLALCVALLSACGGGGGGGAVSMEPPTDSAALMRQLADARTEIAGIPLGRQPEYENKIAALEQDLAAARVSVAELMAQLEIIVQEIQEIKISSETPEPSPPEIPTAADCHAEEKVLVGDNCQSCEADEQLNTANNTCEPLPPTAAECHAQSQILVGDSCQSCPPNMQFSENQCVVIPPTAAACHANEQILVGNNCESCEVGEQFNTANNTCEPLPPTAAACHAQSQILVGDSCQNCEADEQFNTATNRCDALPPTAADCHAEEKILVGDSCQSCETGKQVNTADNTCESSLAALCHANSQIVFNNRYCKRCEAGEQFNKATNTCEPLPPTAGEMCNANGMQWFNDDGGNIICRQCPPIAPMLNGNVCTATVESCNAHDKVKRFGRLVCDECSSDTTRKGNVCLPSPPTAAECHANLQILVNGNCQNCEAGKQFDTANNTCKALPTAAECHANLQILVNGNCQSCDAGKRFSINECVAIPTAAECHANLQILVNDNCQSCEAGERFSINECVAIPTAAECHANLQILVNGNCQNCEAGKRFSINECVAIPTAAECHTNLQILVNGNCQNCEAGKRFSINECVAIPTAAECHTKSQILVNGNCQNCDYASERYDSSSRECRPVNSDDCHRSSSLFVDGRCQQCDRISERYDYSSRECRPTEQRDCRSSQQLVDGRCQSCPPATPQFNRATNQCDVAYGTEEYWANPGLDEINAHYAYEQGYFGQGVTVVNMEQVLASHEDLRANVLTMDINVDYSDTGVSNLKSNPNGEAFEEYLAKYNGDRFAKEYLNFLLNDTGVDINEVNFRLEFHGTASGGIIVAEKNDIGGHGVAPQAKLIPISDVGVLRGARYYFDDTTKSNTTDLQYIIDNKIPIVNHSIWLHYRSLLGLVDYELVKDSDSIFVWSSGNASSNTHRQSRNNHITLPFNISGLEDNWLIVQSYHYSQDRHGGVGCGDVKRWCVSGSPNFGKVPSGPDDNSYSGFSGTSAAAPSVSGALAVLKSAAPEMPMTAIRAILLTTATDIGDPGIDDVYGWGFVNIYAGITLIENMETEAMAGLSSVPFANLRGELPSGFAHMHDDFSELSIAIKLTDNLHYNIGLGDMMAANNDAPDVPLGDGATDMLADSESDSRRGFFAYGDIDSELGLRYYGGTGGFRYIAEGQHAKTNQRFFAGDFGSLGGVSGKVYSGKVGFTRDMNMAGMQIFGDYERAAVGGDGDEGNLIVGVRDAQAESWMAGISFGDIWKYGDKIKLSARQEMGLSGGDLIVRYPHAVGDFHETFIGEGTQEIEVREAFLPLKQKALMLYTAGYAQQFTAKSEWAAALEYNAGNNAKAISLIWQGEF